MSNDVKDFAYYAGAAERVIGTIQDDWPTVDVAATAAIAQVFATLAIGAPKTSPPTCDVLADIEYFPSMSGDPLPCILRPGHPDYHKTVWGNEWL